MVSIKKILKDESGSAMVIFAVSLITLLVFCALVIDLGLIYINNSRLVNAADAAVLAGAQELPSNPDLAEEIALEYAIFNGASEDEINVFIEDDNKTIRVESQRQVRFLIAPIIGINSSNTQAKATASVAPLSSGIGVVPLGVEEQDFVFGQRYYLKDGAQHQGDAPFINGWFGILRLGGSGASVYENNFKHGYDGLLKVGDIVDCQTGNISGPTSASVAYRMGLCTHDCTADKFDKSCARLLIVPVINYTDSDKKKIEIKGFSLFLLEGVGGLGKLNYVYGRFVQGVVAGNIDDTASDSGLYGVKLSH